MRDTHVLDGHAQPDVVGKFEVLGEPFLIIKGVLQNLDGVISVKAAHVEGLRAGAAAESHDFH